MGGPQTSLRVASGGVLQLGGCGVRPAAAAAGARCVHAEGGRIDR